MNITQSKFPAVRFGNTTAKPVPESGVTAKAAAPQAPPALTQSVPAAALKAYTLSGKPAQPKFGASLPGFDLQSFSDNSEVDFRLVRLYNDAKVSAKGEEVTPEDFLRAVLADFLADAKPNSQHGSSFLGATMGLHGNEARFLNSAEGKNAIAKVQQALDRLEAAQPKEEWEGEPSKREASMELLEHLSTANQVWRNAQQNIFDPSQMPGFLNMEIVLQVIAGQDEGLAGNLLRDLTKDLDINPRFNIKPHLPESAQARNLDSNPDEPGLQDILVPGLSRLDSAALSELRDGRPNIQGQHVSFQVLEQVLKSSTNAETLKKLGVTPTANALIVGVPGTGKTDLVQEFAQNNAFDAVFKLDGRVLAKLPKEDVTAAIQNTYAEALATVAELKAEGKQPKVLVFMDNLESTSQPKEGEPPLAMSNYYYAVLRNPELQTEGLMSVGATANVQEASQVLPNLKVPLKALQIGPNGDPKVQAAVIREVAKTFKNPDGSAIFPEGLDYTGIAPLLAGKTGRDIQMVLGQAIELALGETTSVQPEVKADAEIQSDAAPAKDSKTIQALGKAALQGTISDKGNPETEPAKPELSLSVTDKHLRTAVETAIFGVQDMNVLENQSAAKKKLIAYHELGHALAAITFNRLFGIQGNDVDNVTIIPKGHSLGLTTSRLDGESAADSQGYMFAQIVKALGSLPAEKLVSRETHAGVRGDLNMANQVALEYLNLGMGDNKVVFDPSQPLTPELAQQVNQLLNTAQSVSEELLKPLAPLFEELSADVLKNHTVSGKEISERLDTYLKAKPRTYKKMQRNALKVLSKAGLFSEKIERQGLLRRRTVVGNAKIETPTPQQTSTKEPQE